MRLRNTKTEPSRAVREANRQAHRDLGEFRRPASFGTDLARAEQEWTDEREQREANVRLLRALLTAREREVAELKRLHVNACAHLRATRAQLHATEERLSEALDAALAADATLNALAAGQEFSISKFGEIEIYLDEEETP